MDPAHLLQAEDQIGDLIRAEAGKKSRGSRARQKEARYREVGLRQRERVTENASPVEADDDKAKMGIEEAEVCEVDAESNQPSIPLGGEDGWSGDYTLAEDA